MFFQLFLFEIQYRKSRPATYLYFLVFFIMSFLGTSTGWTPASEKVYHNSPYILADFNVFYSMVMMLVCSAVMGVPLYRDIEYKTKDYYLTYPITKAGYFWGRYLGSFLFVFLIGLSVSFGLFAGTFFAPLFGQVPVERIGPNHWFAYIQPYFTMALPNLFLASSIFFGLVAFFRDVKVIYTGSILLFIAYLLAQFLTRDIEHKNLVMLLDPFALNTFQLATKFYTPAEKNSMIIPVEGMFLLNRLLWTGVGMIILFATYFSFSFKRFFGGSTSKKKLEKEETQLSEAGWTLPLAHIDFGQGYYRRIMANLAKIEFLNIVRDNYFKAILVGGVVFLVIDYWIGDTLYSVSAQPLTVNLMELKNYNYVLFIFIIIIFYTGEAIHREKTSNFASINDALPVPDWVFYGSKLIGISFLALLLATIPLIVGVVVQVLKGYYRFDLPVYFSELYLISFIQYLQIVMLSFAVHTIVNSKFAGHAVGLLIWICMFLIREFGEMNYNLFFYSYYPNYKWSDMDGISSMAEGIFWFNLYWMFFGAILLAIAALFYNRGVFSSRKERWQIARKRFGGALPYVLSFFVLGFIFSGFYCYYNVSILNNYISAKELTERQAVYEKKLKKYERLAQPKITSLKVDIDVFPEERKARTHASLRIINRSGKPMYVLHLNGTGPSKVDSFTVRYNGKPLTKVTYPLIFKRSKFNLFRPKNDTALYRIYALEHPLLPGDSATMEISAVNCAVGFTNTMSNTDLLKNGTFFAGGLPSFGYNPDAELSSDEKRKKYKLLPKKEELPAWNDTVGIRTMLFNDDADWVTLDITVSTIADQIAIAPGKKMESWKKGNRIYTRFVQQSPKVDLFFDVVSARYATKIEQKKIEGGGQIPLELYYHKYHDKNLERFLAAYREGLDFFSRQYGNYQYDQLRLLEFPKYRSFAQSFPNTVSYSEAFGYTADFKPGDFDYAYYVTAHELAHQWWGHQVSPNKTRGANLISEALAEYTALILTERKYGRDNMKRFLKQELEDYLKGRANEAKKEQVFINCDRPYEWYNKGSLILYGLRDLIGEDSLNKALHEFRNQWAFRENPPFPGSHDLYNAIEKKVPDSLKYYLDDTWNKITLYENKILETKVEALPGKDLHKITLKIFTRKMYADSSGVEAPAKRMNDYIDIGIFAPETENSNHQKITHPLYLRKHRLKEGEHSIILVVKGNAVKAGIDPYLKLIDRIPDDNVKDL